MNIYFRNILFALYHLQEQNSSYQRWLLCPYALNEIINNEFREFSRDSPPALSSEMEASCSSWRREATSRPGPGPPSPRWSILMPSDSSTGSSSGRGPTSCRQVLPRTVSQILPNNKHSQPLSYIWSCLLNCTSLSMGS